MAKSRSRPSSAFVGGGAGDSGGRGGGAAQPATIRRTATSPSSPRQRRSLRGGRGGCLMALLQCSRRLVEGGVELAELVGAVLGDAVVEAPLGELGERILEHADRP